MGIRQIYDGLMSALSGAGRPFDRGQTCYLPNLLSDLEIEAAFRASWLMRKIITKPATEMTRAGRDWQADKEAIEKIEAEEKRLGIKGKLHHAEVLRGKGGGGMVLYVKGDADQMAPIDPERITAGGLTRVHVWHRSRFQLGKVITTWDDPWFGHPSYYEVDLGGSDGRQKFHPSRVVAFRGKEVDDSALGPDRWWWGDSMVEVVKEAVDNVHIGENGFAKLIRRSRIRRMGVPKLLEKVATTDAEANFTKRVSAIAMGENNDDITWYDAGDGEGKGGETITDTQMVWAGIPEIKASYLAVAAAAANMPATVLLGKSPDGMNATGSSDADLWEQEVKARQDLEHRPCLDQLDVALIPSALGKVDDSVWWEFAPLSMMSEKEKTETFKVFTDAVDKLDATGLSPKIALEKAVQNTIVERGYLTGYDDALGEVPLDERFPSRLAEERPDDVTNGGKEDDPDLASGGNLPTAARRRAANDAAPRTMYVSRKVESQTVIALKAWAKEQGLPDLDDDLHVTIGFSRTPVDWIKMGAAWTDYSGKGAGNMVVTAGGPRVVEPLGDRTAVLMFASSDLSWRNREMREAGASWDYDDYQPHISLTGEPVDLTNVVPYRGKIVLGPELFSEVREDWKSTIEEE